jgi:hypothetical protein
MTRALANLAVNAQFQVWFNTTNFLATYLSTEVVTANAAGAVTTGNGHVNGFFSANTLAATNYRGGNSSVSGNATFTSNVAFQSGIQLFNTNYQNVNVATSGVSTQVVDSFLLNTYRGAEYYINVKNGAANQHQISKILLLQDGTNGTMTEYAIIQSNGTIGVFSSTQNSTAAILSFTPNAGVTAANVQGTKVLITL